MDLQRREFLIGCSAGALGAIAAPAWAWADRVRVLGEPADLDRPRWGGQISPDLQRWLGSTRVGQAAAHGPLLVFWLTAKDYAPPLDVTTLDEARKSGRARHRRARPGDGARRPAPTAPPSLSAR